MKTGIYATCNNWLARKMPAKKAPVLGTMSALALGLCVLLPPFYHAQALSSPPPDTHRQIELTRLVRQDCGSCHGMSLTGGLGKSLLPADLQELSVQDLSLIILDGVTGTPMPPWRGLLEPQEAQWIARQLKAGSIKRGNR